MAPSQHQEPGQRREMKSLSETPEGTNPVGALMTNSRIQERIHVWAGSVNHPAFTNLLEQSKEARS